MIYEFQIVGGTEVIEESFSIKDCPELGTLIHRNGHTYRRIMSAPQIDADVKNICRGYPYISSSMPRNGAVPGCEHDKKGRPIIRSRLHEKEVCAMGGLVRD